MSSPWTPSTYICRACRASITRQTRRYASSEARRSTVVPDTPVRTRFAPSPTGYLHLGSVRTALFNYLIAKRTGGQFLLRIEDTDQKRTIPGAERRILDDLRWLGLQWDEGPEIGGPYGPYRQSERNTLYTAHSDKLIASGQAYRCFCPAHLLHAKGQQRSQSGLATLYDRTCYHIPLEESRSRAANGEDFVVRLKADERHMVHNDIVGGPYELSRTAARQAAAQGVFDDFVLMKTDGTPTYHFANVVDDYHMKITHVIRGVEWQISTPKHLSLYNAFGWKPPAFGHIGLLLNVDGTKMSKRDKTFDLRVLKNDGVLPEALVNFLALHGWSHLQRNDYMTLKELEHAFDLSLSNTNPTVSLAKLWFLAPKHALQRVESGGAAYEEILNNVCSAVLETMSTDYQGLDKLTPGLDPVAHRDYIDRVLRSDAKNYTRAKDFVRTHSYFFLKNPQHLQQQSAQSVEEGKRTRISQGILSSLKRLAVGDQVKWDHDSVAEAIAQAMHMLVEPETGQSTEQQIKKKEVWQVLRVILTGGEKGPSLIETMEILGPEVVLNRIRDFSNGPEIPIQKVLKAGYA